MTGAPPTLIYLQLVVAGVGIHLAITHLAHWIRRRGASWPAWFGLSALGMSVVLVVNVFVFVAPSGGVLLLRTIALSLALLCLLKSVGAFAGRSVRYPLVALALLMTGRLVLWLTTDLVYAHRIVAGAPRYGPLVAVTAVPALLLLIVHALIVAGRLEHNGERTALLMGTGVGILAATATFAVGDPRLAELLSGYWTLPELVVLQLVVIQRRVTSHDLEVRRHHIQTAVAGLAEHALVERSAESLVHHAREVVEAVLGTTCEIVLGSDRSTAAAGTYTSIPGPDGVAGQLLVASDVDDAERQFLGTVGHILAASLDRVGAELELERRSLHDELTGLPNRAHLRSHLAARLGPSSDVALIFLDLDGFKDINDSLGHAVGDEVLLEVGRRLASVTAPGDVTCRFGGDEFVVVCVGSTSPATAVTMLSAIAPLIRAGGRALHLTASVGIAVATPGATPDSLARDADTAMYRAKEGDEGRVVEFDPTMRYRLLNRLKMQHDLARAADAGEIEVHYQPVVDLRSRSVVGVEALARWRHEGHLLPPTDWVPVAEASGAIGTIGRSVLRDACAATLLLPADLGVAVNVSARQLAPSFAAVVDEALSGGLAPERLTLELTESALVEDPVMVADLLANLRRRGVRIAIDDFGTGFSSLSQLVSLPIDILKIDRSFVAAITDTDGYAVAATIVALARSLDLDIVAEGIETPQQADLLQQMGCTYAQGYLFGRPGPLADHWPARGGDATSSRGRSGAEVHA
jgi:diguanylate cyclase (GGDEF)-like protein